MLRNCTVVYHKNSVGLILKHRSKALSTEFSIVLKLQTSRIINVKR